MNPEQLQLNPQYVVDDLLRQLNKQAEELAVLNAVNRSLQEKINELEKPKEPTKEK